MKQNYDLIMEQEIKKITREGRKPTLLLHSCCAPCSCAVIEYLLQYFEITIFFYNPNITFEDEYKIRLEEQKDYLKKRGYNIEVIEGNYNSKEDFFEKVKGLEKAKEGGERCFKCYNLRLEETALKAKELGFEYFSSVLSISPLKNAQWINEIGNSLAEKYQIKFLNGDFKKKSRYLQSVNISKEFNLYRQDYCGCVFSKMEREEKKMLG
ncbi:epoxyqueuosine reductase QueH [uncultured Fusobacterium sp.]|uniref:epoxyqueuosine reductase QueH n=1 Tax=uncultured Fusobacterium sp. TaxID=159267 RepID=UPI0025E39AFA|nr:epoxyqueuosine reductase QueH [uncultured Fusobacterium sp.]